MSITLVIKSYIQQSVYLLSLRVWNIHISLLQSYFFFLLLSPAKIAKVGKRVNEKDREAEDEMT